MASAAVDTADDANVAALIAMGVDDVVAVAALRRSHGDISAAALLASSEGFADTVKGAGSGVTGADGDAAAMPPAFIDSPVLGRATSYEVMERWAVAGRPPLSEYARAADMICVSSAIMSSCKQQRVLEHVERLEAAEPLRESPSKLVQQMVRLAFGSGASKSSHHDVPGLSSGCMYELAMNFIRLLRWEQRSCLVGLREIIRAGSSGDAMICMGLMARGAQECSARRRWALNSVLGYVPGAGDAAAKAEAELAGATGGAGGGESAAVGDARSRVMSFLLDRIDEIKEQAFRSVFEEPTKMYYSKAGDSIMEGDVVVHGSNTYLAALMATLGVRLPRLPLMHDEAKGIIDAREAGLGAAMDELWKDENLGKAWTLVPACRSARLTSRLMRNSWCFRRSTPVETANAAVDPSGTASRREQLAVYLEAFARYFRAEHIVPMLIANACANESLRSSLNTLYNSLPETDRALAPSWHCHTCAFPENRRESLKCEQCGGDPPPPPEPDSDDEDGGGVPEDVSFWLYDSEGDWSLHMNRAKLFLRYLGVLP